MMHPLDRPIGSDLSYRVFELRRERGELGAGGLDRNHQRLQTISGYNPRVFVADMPEFAGDSANPTPLGVAVGERDSE